MGRREWAVGVDFGGTNIKIGLVDARGRVVRDAVLPTAQHATPMKFVRGIRAAIEGLVSAQRIVRTHLRGVGVGAPGLIDGDRGVIHRLVNVPGGWRGVPLRRMLEQHLRCPCAIENDVNVMALGEWRFGAGRRTRHSVYMTLGTGVGGGLVVNGQLVRGTTGSAGEIGHTVVQPGGRVCACGARGCLETVVGAAAILRQARQAIRAGSRVLAKLERRRGHLSPEVVSQAAAAGDRAAKQIWQELGYYLGLTCANLVNVLNPERIVIGGGVANAWPHFIARVRTTMRAQAFEVPAHAVQVVRAQLGDRAGIVGGAMLVWEQGNERIADSG